MELNITAATAQGLRSYQEDRMVIHRTDDGHVLAVMDGHGGSDVAELCRQKLPELWDNLYDSSLPETSIAGVFYALDGLAEKHRSGAAVSLVYVPLNSSRVYIAILGDAPVVAALPTGEIHVSPEHNVRTNAAELKAAEARGGFYQHGYIYNGHSGLQMSRALGDCGLRPILSQQPDVYALDVDGFVLLATDGVFDPGHSNTQKEIAAVVELIRGGANAQNIVDRAIEHRTGDNVTAILIRKEKT